MAILKKKTDSQKQTTHVSGVSAMAKAQSRKEYGDGYAYRPGQQEREKAADKTRAAKAKKDATTKNPIKKAVKKVKGVLPKTTITESYKDVEARNQGSTKIKNRKGKVVGSHAGQSREAYVKEEKAAGRTVTGRKEVKKGWGTKGKKTMKVIE